MSTVSTTKTYIKLLDNLINEMADVYQTGLESGQCEVALKEQIRTSFMKVFKMDLIEATECTKRVVSKTLMVA